MKITVTIESDTVAEAIDVLEKLNAKDATVVPFKRTVDKLAEARAKEAEPEEAEEAEEPEAQPEPPRRRRRTKAEMEAARAAEAAAKEAEDEDEDEDEDDDLLGGDTGFTMEQVLERASEVIDAGKTAKVKAALADAGVKRVTELKPNQFAAFMKALG